MAKRYKTTKKECERNIKGVCEGCGGNLEAIETVDNSGDPTYWQGCNRCQCFRSGIQAKYFKVARQLVEEGRLIIHYSMPRSEYECDDVHLQYWLQSQTSALSPLISYIHKLLIEHEGE